MNKLPRRTPHFFVYESVESGYRTFTLMAQDSDVEFEKKLLITIASTANGGHPVPAEAFVAFALRNNAIVRMITRTASAAIPVGWTHYPLIASPSPNP